MTSANLHSISPSVQVSPPQVLAVDDAKIRHRDVYNVHPNSLYPSYHPKHSSTPPPSIVNLKYDWKTGRWGNCSSCGVAGKRQRSVRCSKSTSNHDLQYVEDYLCDLEKRPVNITNCSDVGCRMWNFGQWSECSETCQSTRQVICRNETERLSESQCDPLTKPHDRKTCCHIKWRSVWTAVSRAESISNDVQNYKHNPIFIIFSAPESAALEIVSARRFA